MEKAHEIISQEDKKSKRQMGISKKMNKVNEGNLERFLNDKLLKK